MSLPNSKLAFKDCEDFLEQALADPKGARLYIGAENKATYFRMRCNHFRVLDRDENNNTYQPGDPMYGKSIYDVLALVLKVDTADDWYVYAEKKEIADGAIETLSELGE